MALNHSFWARAFRRDFVPRLRAVIDTVERRVLPAFDAIDQEAEAVAQEAWDAFMSAPGDGEGDVSAYAEAARDAGLRHYDLLSGVRQGMINLFAAALYHTFEQQAMFFLRREILAPHEEHDRCLFRWKVFRDRLGQKGVQIHGLPSWTLVEELELVANTVKHADGDSAEKLRVRRPDLFRHPAASDPTPYNPRVYHPLTGEDVYVSISDLHRYRDALIAFWDEMVEALSRARE